jgi:hypothetical protein
MTDADLVALARKYFGSPQSPDTSIPAEHATSLAEAFGSVLAELRAKTSVRILLPSRLGQPVSDAKSAVVERLRMANTQYRCLTSWTEGIRASLRSSQHKLTPAMSLRNSRPFARSNCLEDFSAISDRLATGDRVPQRTSGGKMIRFCIKSSESGRLLFLKRISKGHW